MSTQGIHPDAQTIAEPGPVGPGFILSLRMWWGAHPLLQLGLILALAVLLWGLGVNTVHTMHRLGLSPGFAFLGWPANFAIGDTLIAYGPGDSYARALLVGLVNTAVVSALGCVLATLLGLLLALARLSGNPLLAGMVRTYVEVMRNTPLLLQLFFWSAITHALPPPRQSLTFLGSVYLSNRGIYVPVLEIPALPAGFWILAVGAALAVALGLWTRRARGRLLRDTARLAGLAVAALAVFVVILGGPPRLDLPALQGFNIRGGATLSPEFAALLTGLVINAAAAICEIVRAGIQSVPGGQREAGQALGLSRGRVLRLVVLPQALRVITPLMTSSYLDLTKNSSLAVAIGFPDLVSIANTSANQTGQAFEMILILVIVYLALNLSVSYAINRYNTRLQARERPGGAA